MSRAVIVTGASHGIGRAAAVLFARKGYSTVINYHRSESEALSLAHSLTLEGCSVLAVQADVSDPVQVKELFQRTEAAGNSSKQRRDFSDGPVHQLHTPAVGPGLRR